MILYTKDPKNSTRTFLKPENTFSEVVGHKNSTKKLFINGKQKLIKKPRKHNFSQSKNMSTLSK